MTHNASAPKAAIFPHAGGMIRRRHVVGLAIVAVLLAALLGFLLAPSASEQAAMKRRAALALAETTYAQQGPRQASDVLGPSPSTDPTIMRAQLRYAAEAGLVDRHIAIVSGPGRSVLSAEELRAAYRFYTARVLPQHSTSVLQALASRDLASVDELLLLGRAHSLANDNDAAVSVARRLAARLNPGENPPAGLYVINTLSHNAAPAELETFARSWLGDTAPLAMVLATAPALIESGEAALAVEALRSRRSNSAEAGAAFDYALRIAAQTEPELRTELTGALLGELPTLSGEARTVAVHDLFAYGDLDQVISSLRQSGAWRSEPLRAGFVAAMVANRRQTQLRDMLLAEAGSGAPIPAARQLAEIGFPGDAAHVLQTVAAKEGPASAAMSSLLYIWRTHRIQPDLEWLGENASRADADLASMWVDRIAQAKSPEVALGVLTRLEQSARPEVRTTFAVMQARYLGWEGDSPALRIALSDATQGGLSKDQATELFHIACSVHDAPSARRAAHFIEPSRSPEADRCLSRLALDAAREALAEGAAGPAARYYGEAAALDDLSAQDNFDYAQALEVIGNTAAALRRYEAALATLSSPTDEPRSLILRAAVLQKLGRRDEARKILETAHDADPDDRGIQLMLADLYIDLANYQEATGLLEIMHQADPKNRSLELKLADLYINRRTYAEARDILEKVYNGDPDNRSVRLKLADIYVSLGNYREALAITSGTTALLD